MTEQELFDAARTRLAAAVAPAVVVDLGDLSNVADTDRPAEYVELAVSWMFGGTARYGVRQGVTGWRITTRVVSRWSPGNARITRTNVAAALAYAELAAGGSVSTPVERETEDDIAADDGWWSGLTTWTCAT